MAGWLAGVILTPDNLTPRSDDDLQFDLDCARWGDAEEADDGDDYQTFIRLLETRPNAEDAALIAVYRDYEAQTLELLRRPAIWQSIERVADALLETGELSNDEASALVSPEVFFGAIAPCRTKRARPLLKYRSRGKPTP
jgi:hypothetical protein